MGTVEKRDKHKKRRFVSPEEKLERELKDCMHCRFFWGHNNRCANIDRYQESVAMGLTARQLIFSIASVVVGGGIVLLLYKYIGLTGSAYVAIPCVAPIALGGFYSFNGMNFYEYMGKKLHFMFGNKALTYVSTEGEPAIKQLEVEQNEQVKKKGRKAEPETVTADSAVKKQEEFEAMKKKTRNMLFGLVAVIVAAVAGIAAYKAMH